MELKINLNTIYVPSEDVVARDIQGEFILIPVISGIADEEEDAIFSLNETGRAIWDRLDGERCLGDIIKELTEEFDASQDEISRDVIGLVEELLKRKMVVGVSEKEK